MSKNNDDLFQGLDDLSIDLFGQKRVSSKKNELVKKPEEKAKTASKTEPSVVKSKETSMNSDVFGGLDDLSRDLFGTKKAEVKTEKTDKTTAKTDYVIEKEMKKTKKETVETQFGDSDMSDTVPCSKTKSNDGKKPTQIETEEKKEPEQKTVRRRRERGENITTLVVPFGNVGDKNFSFVFSDADALTIIDGEYYKIAAEALITSACFRYSPLDLEVVVYDFESRSSSCFAEYAKDGKLFVPQVRKIKFVTSGGFPILDCLDEIENEESNRRAVFEKKGFANYAEYIADCKRKNEIADLKRIVYVFSEADKPFGETDDNLDFLIRSKFEVLLSQIKDYGIAVVLTCANALLLNDEIKETFTSRFIANESKGVYENENDRFEVTDFCAAAAVLYKTAAETREKFCDFPDEQTVEEI